MFRIIKSIFISISILLLIQQCSLSNGFASIRSGPSSYARVLNFHNQHVRLMMAEPQQQQGSDQDESTDGEIKASASESSGRSKRRRITTSSFKRLRSRLISLVNRKNKKSPAPPTDTVATEEIPSNSNATTAAQIMDGNYFSAYIHMDAEEAPSAEEEVILSNRQSTAGKDVDLSGTWRPIVTSDFKKEYDSYLLNCSESFMFRKAVVNGIGYQRETIRQLDDGITLEITATNPAGNWKRTLVASDESQPLNTTITDPDGDEVVVEAWWEENGTAHKSLLRGKPRVQGGAFETVRYLESNDVLVCESSFVPNPEIEKFKYGFVTWKFQRKKSK